MKKFAFLVCLFSFLNISIASAQQGLFGTCTRDMVIKLIDAGLLKNEIVQLCRQDGNKPVQKTPPPAEIKNNVKSKPPTQTIAAKQTITNPKNNMATLDGIWTIDSECGLYTANADNVALKNGKFTGALFAGEDTLSVMGTIEKDGTISGYGNGSYVFSEFSGKITNWQKGTGNGTVSISGEIICDGTWQMNKNN